MPIAKNWKAIAFDGTTGPELIVTGEANTGLPSVMPELEEKIPPGSNPAILLLNLLNAVDAEDENYKAVQFNKKIENATTYESVGILHHGEIIDTIIVEVK